MLKNKILLLSLSGLTIKEIYHELKKDPELKAIDENEAEQLAENIGSAFTTIIDEDYPKKLRCINNPPCIIYYRGNIKLLNMSLLCITGSKFASYYGLMVTQDTVQEIKDEIIITGISYGIDKQVVISSLENNKVVVGVLASGFSNIYPVNLNGLCSLIEARGGLVVSLFAPKTKVIDSNFIQRNEFLVSLSERVLVVEAKQNSESIYIADYASEQNKEVMAIPGSVYSENSKGTNLLIQEGATVYSIDSN